MPIVGPVYIPDRRRVGGMPSNTSSYSSDGSVVRLLIEGAAHHEDLRFSLPSDSPQLTAARAEELAHVQKWLSA